ncbi:MAG: TRAP transporter small permease [Pseudomonadota bacterium]
MAPEAAITALRRLNRGVAVLVGLGLLGCAAFVLVDIVLRQLGGSFGGTDEISGYVMAIATAWGMAFTLLELGHVRIDLLRARFPGRARAFLDLFSLLVLATVVTLIAWRCWPVLATSLKNGSTANTPLETPLAWVQTPWLLGWVWFALMAWVTLFAAGVMVLRGQFDESARAIGASSEVEQA